MSSLLDAMIAYAKANRQRLHTPGHKGKLWAGRVSNIAELDITELGLEVSDLAVGGRVFPRDLLVKAEVKAANSYRAKAARLLTGGASQGIKAAIMALDGDIIMGADSHRSIHEGLRLSRRRGIIVYNDTTKEGLAKPLSVEQIHSAYLNNPHAKAVLITSPTYYGVSSQDMAKAAGTIHDLGLRIIVDSAHGAHFGMHKALPKQWSEYADITVLSGHKTLSVLTQGAYLCINDISLVDAIDDSLRLLGTTSPSYLILASLEHAIESISHHARKLVPRALSRIDRWLAEFGRYYGKAPRVITDDPLRVVMDAGALGMTGFELEASERERGIECELATDRMVVYIFGLEDSI